MSATPSLSQPTIRFPTDFSVSTTPSKQNENENELASIQEWPTKSVCHWRLELYQTDEGYLIRTLDSTSEYGSSSLQPLTFLPHGGVIELPQSDVRLAIIGSSQPITSNNSAFHAPEPALHTQEPAFHAKPPLMPSGIYFHSDNSQFFVDNHPILQTTFTALEHDLLKYLYDHVGIVCSYYRLGTAVWKGWVRKATIVKTVSNIRKKLNQVCPGTGSRYLVTSRGHQPGYTLIRTSQ